MLSKDTIACLATELHASAQSRVQVEHFSKRHPEMRIEAGYAVSRAWVARKLAEGRPVIGHKIGLTSRAMQQASQITEPDYGTLLDDMLFETGSDIPFKRFIAPRIEQFDRHTKAMRKVFDTVADNAGIVLGGSFTRPVQAATGDSFHADYGPLGAISFRMV